jgi:hypothetical protein
MQVENTWPWPPYKPKETIKGDGPRPVESEFPLSLTSGSHLIAESIY